MQVRYYRKDRLYVIIYSFCLGRPVAIDWALPKKDFQNEQTTSNSAATTDIDVKSEDIKEEVEVDDENENSDAESTQKKDISHKSKRKQRHDSCSRSVRILGS